MGTTNPAPAKMTVPSQEGTTALVSSLVLHLCLLAGLALILLPPNGPGEPTFTTLVPSTTLEEAVPLDLLPSDVSPSQEQSSRSSANLPMFSSVDGSDPQEAAPRVDQARKLDLSSTGLSAGALTEKVGAISNAAAGDGDLSGQGTGDGEGGFFGIDLKYPSSVFVVDCSLSMNHPYPGEAKTRFGRVKIELLKTIGRMSDDEKFFMIFFNTNAVPMPADRLIEATPGMQEYYLRWMAYLKAQGRTDPESALMLALRLNPAVIYFLTDGDFNYRVVPNVTAANRRGVVIHTIGFGDDRGEPFLKEIAAKNGGTYKFIPEGTGESRPENKAGDAAYSLVAPRGSD